MVPLLGDLHPPSGGSRPIIVRMKSCYVHDCICFTAPVCSFSVLPSLGAISGGYELRASSSSSRGNIRNIIRKHQKSHFLVFVWRCRPRVASFDRTERSVGTLCVSAAEAPGSVERSKRSGQAADATIVQLRLGAFRRACGA